jgi:hypothetical protein
VDEALDHPFFVKVKKAHKEILSDVTIELAFENESLDKDKLRALFLETILEFRESRLPAS